MGRKKKKKQAEISLPEMSLSPEAKRGIVVIFVAFLSVLCFLGLFGLAGLVGDRLALGQALAFGWGKWVFPIILFWWALAWYKEDRMQMRGALVIGFFLLLIVFSY